MTDKKVGRPTDNPKIKSIHVRLDSESEEILNSYCKNNNTVTADAVRKGIKMLNKLKENK